jgi:hypothetical protein
MNFRYALPLVAMAALAGCAGVRPPGHYGTGWTLLDTCWAPVAAKSCPEARGADLDKCMATVVGGFNAQPNADAQRAFIAANGCPTYIAGRP